MFRSLSGANKAERLAARASFLRFAPNARLVPGPAGGAVYVYDLTGKDGRPRFVAIFFWGTSAKPTEHVSYRSDQTRAENVTQFHANLIAHANRKSTRAAEKSAWVNPAKVGDLLYTSWGYDQTNVEFYAVTRVSGKRVWVREIAGDSETTGFMQAKCWPAMPIRFCGDETMHIARQCEHGYSVKINESATAWLERGREHFSSSYA
jgi:hypothetical protein